MQDFTLLSVITGRVTIILVVQGRLCAKSTNADVLLCKRAMLTML